MKGAIKIGKQTLDSNKKLVFPVLNLEFESRT